MEISPALQVDVERTYETLIPYLFYGAPVAFGVVIGLRVSNLLKGALTALAAGCTVAVYLLLSTEMSGPTGLAAALGFMFLTVFPNVLFCATMWVTTAINWLYCKLKS